MRMQTKASSTPVVTIVGRPNVGKSSLFNVLLRQRIAIVHEQCGVTRDRVAQPVSWNGYHYQLVDTGGLGVLSEEKNVEFMDDKIRTQLKVAVESSDVMIFLGDIQDGLTELDREVCAYLRKHDKPIIMAVNKCDNDDLIDEADVFSALGFEQTIGISCQHKTNLNDLRMAITEVIPQVEPETAENPSLLITLAGRPNVGKSSIANRLLGEGRVIVSDIAGTTRDAVDIPFTFDDEGETTHGLLIDTAGVKKTSKIDNLVEKFSMQRTEEAVERANLILFVMDAQQGVTTGDKKIGNMLKKEGKPCLIVVNKWDLVRKEADRKEFLEDMANDLPFLRHCPIIFTSATDGSGFNELLPAAVKIREQARLEIPTALLNQVLHDMILRTPPPSTGKGFFKIYYGTMVKNPPAHFIIFCNKKNYCQPHYKSFIEKTIRNAFGLSGIPIEIEYRERTHVQDKFRENGALPGDVKEKMAKDRKKAFRKSKKFRG